MNDNAYAPLRRTFTDVSSRESDSRAGAALARLKLSDQDWSWLLSHPVAVVLGDGGSGKSREFRAQVDRIGATGRTAFLIPIERLCRGDVHEALEPGAPQAAFASWLRSGAPAVFFLDSVDEAKLPAHSGVDPLALALRRLEAAVGERIAQSRFVISSRPFAWTEVEQREVRRVAARLAPSQPAGARAARPSSAERANLEPVRVVRIDRLTWDQVEALAAARGEGRPFLDVLMETGADAFSQHPLDVIDQVDAYRDAVSRGDSPRAPFSTLSRIVAGAIYRRSRPTDASRPLIGLDGERLLAGARRLALATVLQQTDEIRLPGQGGTGVDPDAALRGAEHRWSDQEIRALMSTALFEPAWRGGSRFHHRRTRERLAAEALMELRRAGCSASALFDLLLPQVFGVRTTPAAYVETAGWLCSLDQDFAQLVAAAAPEVIIERGDPGSVPVLTRLKALATHFARYESARQIGHWFDGALLARFATPELQDALEAAAKSSLPEEPRSLALMMARAGQLDGLGDTAIALATNRTESAQLRAWAVLLISEVGRIEHRRALAGNLLSGLSAPAVSLSDEASARTERNRLKVWTIDAVFPAAMTSAETLTVLASLEARNPQNHDELGAVLRRRVASDVDASQLVPFTRDLSALVWRDPSWRLGGEQFPPLTHSGWHLLPLLHELIVRVLREAPGEAAAEWLSVEVDRVAMAGRLTLGPLNTLDKRDAQQLAAAVCDAPRFRRAFFWRLVGAGGPHPVIAAWTRLDQVSRTREAEAPPPWSDVDWLTSDLKGDDPSIDHRAALDAVAWRLSGRDARRRRAAAKLVRWSILARRWDVLSRLRWRPFAPLLWRMHRFRRFAPERLIGWWRRLRRQGWPELRVRLELERKRGSLRRGRELLLAWRALHMGYAESDEAELTRRYGTAIARDIAAGARAFVLQGGFPERPAPLDVWYARRGWRWLAAAEPQALERLSEASLRALMISALGENEWPAFGAVAFDHLELWGEVTRPLVAADMVRPGKLADSHGWNLHRAAQLDDRLRKPLAQTALESLEAARELSPDQIRDAASLASVDPDLRWRLSSLARRRAAEHLAEGRVDTGAVWFAEAFRADPEPAWSLFQDWRRTIWAAHPDPVYALYVAIGEVVGRFAFPHKSVVRTPPRVWGELAIVGRQIVRSSEDVPVAGLIGPRHSAQDLRDSVLHRLAQDVGAEARGVLASLRDTPEFAGSRDWITTLLRQQAELAAKPPPFSEPQVVEFCRTWSRAPTTTAELHDVVLALIRSVEADLATSEFDRRELFRDMSETAFRAWLGEELRRRSSGWFSVTQETVTAGEKRMDLRFETPSANAVVVVELKIAGPSWPKLTLFDHLEHQLADQYLISRRVRSGIYLVADFDHKLRFETPSGPGDFAHLAAELVVRAEAVGAARAWIDRLDVVTFQVTPPPRRRRRAKKAA